MPLYEYRCKKCLHIEERLLDKKLDMGICMICYGMTEPIYSRFSINVVGGTPSNLTKQLHSNDSE